MRQKKTSSSDFLMLSFSLDLTGSSRTFHFTSRRIRATEQPCFFIRDLLTVNTPRWETAAAIQSHPALWMWALVRLSFKHFTSHQHPSFPSGTWRKFEGNIQNLLLLICMPGGARLLSIAPFLQPFDIPLDVGVCLRWSSDTYCSLFQKEGEEKRESEGEMEKEGEGDRGVRGCRFINRPCGAVLHTNT